MLSIQYCQCNTVNTILIINCKQSESFKVRAKFSSHPLQIRSTFFFQSAPHSLFQSAPNPFQSSFQCKNINKSI